MKKHFLPLLLLLLLMHTAKSQNASLVGYWHNWNDANAPYIPLDQIDTRYTHIEIAFAVPTSPTDMNMVFVPDGVSQSIFISKIQGLQSLGKKVLLSIGGANANIDLSSLANKNAFVTSMNSLLNTYGFDGMDIDIEHGNSILANGTIATPSNAATQNLIDAIKQIMLNFRITHAKKLLLTLAPETAYIQGGQSAYGGIWGGYLPIVDALRDSLDLLQVQLYNSGSMFGIDGSIYTQGTADFIVAMTEAVIQGFTTAGGIFTGIPANKVAVGLPACSSAAGGGFTDTAQVKSAINYLRGSGPKPGTYTLVQAGGYPNLGGMMTWSINWDAISTCSSAYEFASTYSSLFSSPNSDAHFSPSKNLFHCYPNPANESIYVILPSLSSKTESVTLYNSQGIAIQNEAISSASTQIFISHLPKGIYFISLQNDHQKFVKN